MIGFPPLKLSSILRFRFALAKHTGRRLPPIGLFPWAALCVSVLSIVYNPVGAAESTIEAPTYPISTKIAPGALLKVTVFHEPSLSGLYTVDDGGSLHFQLADDGGKHKCNWKVPVSGKIVDEARGALLESLHVYFVAPEVQLTIIRMPALQVDVRGEARTPGKLSLPLRAHLSDALALSGYRTTADINHLSILRSGLMDPTGHASTRSIPMDYGAFLRGASAEDPLLQEGDTILLPALPATVPAAELKLIRIRGEVNLEANIPFEPGMTVHDVIQRAGGLKPNADRETVRLVRMSDGKLLELDADRIEADDPVHNFRVGAGDLILVQVRDNSRRFAVLGEVMAPRTFALVPGEKVTVLRAMDRVGGPTKDGDHKLLLRKGFLFDPTQTRDLSVDLDKVRAGKLPDWEIEPGDALVVYSRQPKTSIWKQLLPLALRFLPFGF